LDSILIFEENYNRITSLFSIEEENNCGCFLDELVYGCFSVLGLVAFAGCVWKSQRTSQKIIERHKEPIATRNITIKSYFRQVNFLALIIGKQKKKINED
jgi:hypothetical protein